MKIQNARRQWKLVARGGGLAPGNHEETLPTEEAALARRDALRRAANERGEAIVIVVQPPGAAR
jgi:hypothetical protein